MTDVKALPDNLAEIAKTPEFQATYKAHTVEQLESKLRNLNVAFLSADNKNELVWRLLDATQSADKPAVDDANNKTDAQLPEDEVVPPTDINLQESVQEANENTNESEAEVQPTESMITDANINNDASDASDTPKTDTSQPDTPADKPDDKPANLPKKPEPETVNVKNTGAFNVLEPATVTIMKAGEVTKIAITPTVGKAKIVRNIEQFNQTRGNILTVID